MKTIDYWECQKCKNAMTPNDFILNWKCPACEALWDEFEAHLIEEDEDDE